MFAWTCTAPTAAVAASGPIILQCKDPGRASCMTCQWYCEVGEARACQPRAADWMAMPEPVGR
jgi:hypothetical protein